MDNLNTLCIAKEDITIGNTFYSTHKNYRVSFDAKGKWCIVFGESLSMKEFNKKFDLYIPILQERLKALELIIDGKPVTFAQFKKRVQIHNYGRGKNTYKIIFIGHPRENMFGFYPMQAPNTIALKECYDMYVGLVNGGFEDVDSDDIQWGNCGIPICYGNLRKINQ